MKTFIIWLSQFNSFEIILIIFGIVISLVCIVGILYGIGALIMSCVDHYIDERIEDYFIEHCKGRKNNGKD